MSDVSGIPYMGSMGMGNYFANPFPAYGTPQISSGQIQSPYMPEIYNNQNVVNNLFNTPGGGGGFGKATDYYSQLGAQYSAAGMSPYGVFSDAGRGGGGASPYHTTPDVWNTGASPFQGGGGSSGFGGSIYDYGGGLGSLGASPYMTTPNVFDTGSRGVSYPGTSGIDWGGLFNSGGMGGGARNDPYPGMSMPGGLNSPMTLPQQQPLDYGSLFGRGAGGMGGAPQQSPYTSGIEPDQTGGRGLDAPMEGAPSSSLDWSTLFGGDTGGMAMPGGLNSPMTVPEPQAPAYDYGSLYGKGTAGAPQPEGTRTYDLAPMFEGGGGGFGTGGADTSQLFGGQATGQGGNAFSYNPEPTGSQDVFSQPADAMAEQARARLAGLMGGSDGRVLELKTSPADATLEEIFPSSQDVPPPAIPADVPATETPAESPFDNVPQPVTPDATTPATNVYPGDNPPRPPADIKQGTGLRDSPTLRGVNPRLVAAVAGGSTFLPPGYTVEAVSGAREGKGQAYHRGGRAMDVKIIGPDGVAIPHEGADKTGMYTMLAQGTKTWAAQNDPGLLQTGIGGLGYGGAFGTKRGSSGGANIVPDLMHYDLGGSRGALRPEVQFGNLKPMSAEEQRASLGSQIASGITSEAQRYAEGPNASPFPERSAAATVEERPGVNLGQAISSPPADIPPPGLVGPGYNALDAAANAPPTPVKHSGLELARANIDTPIEKIAMERGGQKAVDQINFMAMGKTPRQLSEQFGGMFMDRAEPLFKSLGITRQDFEQAAKMSPSKQDIKMRFGEMPGGFGPYPDYTGPEAAPGGSGGVFDSFRQQGADVEDRRGELASLMPREFGYGNLPEVAPSLLSGDAGLGNLPMPAQERIDPTAPLTQNEREYMELESRIEFNRNAQQEGRPDRLPLDGPAPGRPDLPPKVERGPVTIDETGGLPDLPFSAAPRSDLGTSGATDFSARARTPVEPEFMPGDMPDMQSLLGYTPQQWPDSAYPQSGMRDFQSPANDYSAFQQEPFLAPWQASIPAGRNSPEVIDAVKAMAARLRTEPAEVAAMIQQETHDNPSALWNPQITPNRYGYRGMTQMGPETFADAASMGRSIGGFPTIEDYQRGTAEQQIAAYADWLNLYTQQNPQGAAAFVNSGALEDCHPAWQPRSCRAPSSLRTRGLGAGA